MLSFRAILRHEKMDIEDLVKESFTHNRQGERRGLQRGREGASYASLWKNPPAKPSALNVTLELSTSFLQREELERMIEGDREALEKLRNEWGATRATYTLPPDDEDVTITLLYERGTSERKPRFFPRSVNVATVAQLQVEEQGLVRTYHLVAVYNNKNGRFFPEKLVEDERNTPVDPLTLT